MLIFAGIVVGSYLMGSIPFGVLASKLRRLDVRAVGSGRTGVTNVLRTVGPAGAGAVFCGDMAKGAGSVLLARFLLPEAYVLPGEIVAGLAAVAGHNWSLYLKFRGGRGVTTSYGALVATSTLVAIAATAAFGVFILVIAASRYVSLGSLTASGLLLLVLLPLTVLGYVLILHYVLAIILVALIFWQHRDNIARLRAGTERRLGEPRPSAAA